MPTEVAEIETDAGWDEAVPVIRQLWSHVDESFVRAWREEDDYRLFGLYDEGTLVAVAGVSVQRVLHHERHLWIHDFVVDEPRRGEGFGTELLRWLAEWARERDCENLALACRDGNDAAREFYEDRDLEAWGPVMERKL